MVMQDVISSLQRWRIKDTCAIRKSDILAEAKSINEEREAKAEHYADKLVPWTLGATGLTYLLTRPVHSQRHIRLWLMW